MTGFREQVKALPFVEVRPDGTLDLWCVTSFGRYAPDVDLGRQFGARLLQFYRATGGLSLAPHIHEAWVRKSPAGEGHVREGFGIEVLGAFARAPAGATSGLAVAEATWHRADDPADLPFISRNADGTLDGWDVRPSGDWTEDCARGRHYGALLARFFRLSGDPTPVEAALEGMAADLDRFEASRAIWTGYVTEIAEIMVASCPRATIHQRAAMAYHEDE